MAGQKNKTGRNDTCPCGSGRRFKYCCIGKEAKPRKLITGEKFHCGHEIELDVTDNPLFQIMNFLDPLKYFCKDHGIYQFSGLVPVKDIQELCELLGKGDLTKSKVMDVYKKSTSKDSTIGLLERITQEESLFKKRKKCLIEAFGAHFDGKYTLSIPSFFIIIESLLREIGNLEDKETIKPTLPFDIWGKKLAFEIGDSVKFFNGFIDSLFKGSQEGANLNRNLVLHGILLDYDNEEWSLILLLTILEIRLFTFFENNLKDIKYATRY